MLNERLPLGGFYSLGNYVLLGYVVSLVLKILEYLIVHGMLVVVDDVGTPVIVGSAS